tara:strand:+ start:1377 stop:2195 length:819 start_codon:yes stop_codon:yes gene_type:complete
MVQVLKADGTFEAFKKSKIEHTVLKAGGSKKFAKEIANKVAQRVHKGTSTRHILKYTLKLLRKHPHIEKKYDLKRAIMSLGPHGFTFEEFFSQVLKNYGYETKVGLILKGKATTHEVDIIAKKDKKYMIECKYHNRIGNNTNVRVVMYTYARFLDLNNNAKHKFNQGWLVTNTTCTPHAIEYSKGVGLKITTWNYASKGGKTLQQLIMEKKLYPITILHSVRGRIKDKLAYAKIVLAKDILTDSFQELKKKTRLRNRDLKILFEEAKQVLHN